MAGSRHLKFFAFFVVALLVGAIPAAQAIPVPIPTILAVDCDAQSDDIDAIQDAVDAAADGDTIHILGQCNFTAALPHRGNLTSISAAAVVVRPVTPINGLTIRSAFLDFPSAIIGSGSQTAFFVAPGNSNVSILGLRFVGFARPIVVNNAANTTIGTGGAVPHPHANRIVGDATMDSAILAAAVDRGVIDPPGTYSIIYGAGGSKFAAFTIPAGQGLTGLSVLGNYITYLPPGLPNGDTNDIVAIDIRQRFGRVVDGVNISDNAVGMFTSEFPSFNMNGIRIHALTPGQDAPTADGFYIRNVDIIDNNLGRLEELDTLPPGDVNAGDIHAAGRAAIVVMRASNVEVAGNGLRSRLSPTPPVQMPGGGVVFGDVSNSSIHQNGIIVVADPSTANSDLGAIGLVDDILRLFGSTGGPPTERNFVVDNIIGVVGDNPPGPFGSQRGIVLNGDVHTTVARNDVKFASLSALNIGAQVTGPGSTGTPVTLSNPVFSLVACSNMLEGQLDRISETNFITSVGSTANAFPGGGNYEGNLNCSPSLALAPDPLGASSSLMASGDAWSARPGSVTLSGPPAGTTVTHAFAAALDGSYSTTFTSTELAAFDDGLVCGVTTASDDLPTSFSRSSDPTCVTKNSLAPPAPVITAPTDGSTLGSALVTVTGTAEAGTTVTVNEGGSPVGTATTDGAGNWSVAITFSEGGHTIDAIATDTAGNNSAPSAAVTFTVDTTAPSVPIITLPADGAQLNTSIVTVAGTADANTTVDVIEGGATIGSTPADGLGDWTIDLAFGDGDHTVTVTATDCCGNTSDPSAPVTFTVDTTAPGAPVILTPLEGETVATSTPSISGTAEANSSVEVFVDAGSIGTVAADGSGNWSIASPALTDGAHNATATATDAAGNTGPSSALRNFSVDTTAPDAPVITSPVDGAILTTSLVTVTGTAEANSSVTVSEGGSPIGTTTADGLGDWSVSISFADGTHTINATATDAVGNVSAPSADVSFTVDTGAPAPPVVLTPSAGACLNTSLVTVSGTAEASSGMTVSEGGSSIGTTSADGSGNWSLDITFADGSHTISVTATDGFGNESASSGVTFNVDTAPPLVPTIDAPAEGAVLTDPAVTVSGTAEADSTVTVYEAGSPIGSDAADGSGDWSTIIGFADGPHTLTVTATDACGNVGPASAARSFEVDTLAPAPPVILNPLEGAVLASSLVTVDGTADPLTNITVSEGGSPIGSTVADGSGSWSVGIAFTDGAHAIRATASDGAGNTSGPSAVRNFSVDTLAPAAPVITTPAQNAVLATNAVAVGGTAEAGSTVKVYEGLTFLGQTVATGSGGWTLTLTFTNGSHTITATSTDAAGNVSVPSAPVTFVVDPTATGIHALATNLTPAPFSVFLGTSSLTTSWDEATAVGTEPVKGYVLAVGRPGDFSKVHARRIIKGEPGDPCAGGSCSLTLAFPLASPGGPLPADDKYALGVVTLFADGHRSDGRCDDGSAFGVACASNLSHPPGFVYTEFLIKAYAWPDAYQNSVSRDVLLVDQPDTQKFEFINWRPGEPAETYAGTADLMAPTGLGTYRMFARLASGFTIAAIYGEDDAYALGVRPTPLFPLRLFAFNGVHL